MPRPSYDQCGIHKGERFVVEANWKLRVMSSGKEQTSLTNEGCVPLQTIQRKINYRPNPIKSQSPSQEFILIFKATYNSVGKSHPATHVANNQTVLSTKNQTENPAG